MAQDGDRGINVSNPVTYNISEGIRLTWSVTYNIYNRIRLRRSVVSAHQKVFLDDKTLLVEVSFTNVKL